MTKTMTQDTRPPVTPIEWYRQGSLVYNVHLIDGLEQNKISVRVERGLETARGDEILVAEQILAALNNPLMAAMADGRVLEALTWIDREYENININHEDFRVQAKVLCNEILTAIQGSTGT